MWPTPQQLTMVFGVCDVVTQNGRCTSMAADESGKCAHHQRMARVMALAPKSVQRKDTVPPSASASTPSSLANGLTQMSVSEPVRVHSFDGPTRPIAASNANVSASASIGAGLSTRVGGFQTSSDSRKGDWTMNGEVICCVLDCVFAFPQSVQLADVGGKVFVTNYRLRFEPSDVALRSIGHYHMLLDDAIVGIPRACVSKVSYPQQTDYSSSRHYDGMPTQLLIKFKDLRTWYLNGDAASLMMNLSRHVFVDSPLNLFAFASGNLDKRSLDKELQGHAIYNMYEDFLRMGIDLTHDAKFRVTELNRNYSLCPTYPPEFVVPAALTDREVRDVVEFRSKGRMPILCYVHPHNSASIWRCAQPKRGIFNSQSPADERLLLHISYSNPNHSKVWVADCRPELNARVNNLTGGGTESSSMQHCTVTFLNIANIHAMRESYESLRSLSLVTNSEVNMTWHSRVEATKWLSYIRLILSSALRVAEAVEHRRQTVLVHCSDGWDRTGQLCALAQILLDARYRTIEGFMQIIEKEWIRVGHKFHDRVGPGKSDNEEQSPVFLQFLDCCWQLWRQFPRYFEFNPKMLLMIADSLFSGRFGTFLGNCDRERTGWQLATRTPSLWTYLLDRREHFSNPFFNPQATNEPLLPHASAMMRQVTLWNEFYMRGAAIPSFKCGAPHQLDRDCILRDTWVDDLAGAMANSVTRIRELEEQVQRLQVHAAKNESLFTSACEVAAPPASPPSPARVDSASPSPACQPQVPPLGAESVFFPPPLAPVPSSLLSPVASTSMLPPSSLGIVASSLPASPIEVTDDGTSSQPATLKIAPPVPQRVEVTAQSSQLASELFPMEIQLGPANAKWACAICSKLNAADSVKCVVCGRAPKLTV